MVPIQPKAATPPQGLTAAWPHGGGEGGGAGGHGGAETVHSSDPTHPCPPEVKNHQKQKEMGQSVFKLFYKSGSQGAGSQEEEGEDTAMGLFWGYRPAGSCPHSLPRRPQMGPGL